MAFRISGFRDRTLERRKYAGREGLAFGFWLLAFGQISFRLKAKGQELKAKSQLPNTKH
jgi:hypothetical protein